MKTPGLLFLIAKCLVTMSLRTRINSNKIIELLNGNYYKLTISSSTLLARQMRIGNKKCEKIMINKRVLGNLP